MPVKLDGINIVLPLIVSPVIATPLRVPFVPESVQTHPGEVLLVTSVFLTIPPLYQVPIKELKFRI